MEGVQERARLFSGLERSLVGLRLVLAHSIERANKGSQLRNLQGLVQHGEQPVNLWLCDHLLVYCF